MSARQRFRDACAQSRVGCGEDGFTLIEMVVALVIIGIVMTALTTFFVNTVSATARQATSQDAIQLVDAGMERARAVAGSALPSGRGYTASADEWNNPVAGVAPYLASTQLTWDSTVDTNSGPSAPIPTPSDPLVSTIVNNVAYQSYWYVGSCWEPLGGGDCTSQGILAPSGGDQSLAYPTQRSLPPNQKPTYAWYYRVIVAVTWHNTACSQDVCSYVSSTLTSAVATEPLFNSNQSTPSPTVNDPGTRTAEVGVPLSVPPLAATGGADPLTWNGSLFPSGVSINSSGQLAGTPAIGSDGPYTSVVSVSDAFNRVGTDTKLAWTVYAALTLNSPGNQSSVGGSSVSLAPSFSGGAPNITWTAPTLPSGLSIDSGGTISGLPTTAGTTTVTLTAADPFRTRSVTFTWKVTPAALVITGPGPSLAGSIQTPVNVTAAATGGTAPITWAATGLPPGLAMSAGGAISGTPHTGGSYTSTITATDSASPAVVTTKAVVWRILDIVTPASAQNFAVNASVSISPTTTGSSGTVTFGSSGLPTGLTMSAAGVISGRPSAAGVYTSTVTATDSVAGAVTHRVVWNIGQALVLSSPTTRTGLSSPHSADIGAVTAVGSGGAGGYVWTATGLPTGIVLDASTGQLTGTAPVAGSASITLTVTDSAHTAVSVTFTWTFT